MTWTGDLCFDEESNPKVANFRNFVGVEVTCADAEGGGLGAG